MKLNWKLCLVLFLVFYLPILTEINIQLAKWRLKNESSIEGITAKFGEPNDIRIGERNLVLRDRYNLKVDSTDEIWVYNNEGIPYWFIYVVTSDGMSIKDSTIDRGW